MYNESATHRNYINKQKGNNMAPIRVLQVVPAMEAGGLETFIMNVYRHIDRERVQFDFLYHYDRPCVFDAEIEALGGNIYRTSVRQDNNLVQYCRQLNTFFAAHPEYTIVHGHYSGFGMFYNHYAKKHGVPVRIGHSHNTATEKSVTGFLDACLSSFFKYGITHRFSCGIGAGRALYKTDDFEVFPNGIEVDSFAYDAAKGQAARARFGLCGGPVFGHIGRFTQQKNHTFLIDLFAALKKIQPDFRLLLVGEGTLMPQVKAKVQALGLQDSVVFAGIQTDTPALYSAMDCFLLPSLFEGFPVVLVEAQAGGLPCFVSDAVSPEAALTGSLHFLPLALGPAGWAKAVLAQPLARTNNRQALFAAGYDISTTATRLADFYLRNANIRGSQGRHPPAP